MILVLLAVATAAVGSPDEDQQLERLTALYRQVCLEAFPDDKAVETLMAERAGRELTSEEVKVTMRDDPARGWLLPDGNATVWLEFPPYHACSVRWNARRIGSLAPYDAAVEAYKRTSPGFSPMPPYEADQGPIHIRGTGEQRSLHDGGAESLLFIQQHITDASRRTAGETGLVLRFVHQLAPPPGRRK